MAGTTALTYPSGFPQHSKRYASQSHSVTVNSTNADVDLTTLTGFTTMFDPLRGKTAYRINMTVSAPVSMRLNSVTNDIIPVSASNPYIDDYADIDKIFVSTANAAVTITITLK